MRVGIFTVCAMLAAVMIASIVPTAAHAAAASPCSYAVNYYCGTVPGKTTRTVDSYVQKGLLTASGSYINETSAEQPVKSVETYANGKRYYTQSASGSVGHTFPRFAATRTYCTTVTMNNNSVPVGCYYLK